MSLLPSLECRCLIISSWAPPMVGGPQYLFHVFSCIAGGYQILTTRRVFAVDLSSGLAGQSLPCRYHFLEGGTWQPALEPPLVPSQEEAGPDYRFSTWLMRTLPRIIELEKLARHLTSLVVRGIGLVQTNDIRQFLGISDTGISLVGTWLLSSLSGRPYSLYLFDLYLGNNLSGWRYWVARAMERSLLKGARTIFVTNEATAAFYQAKYGSGVPVEVIHNSLPKGEVTGHELSPRASFRIVYTGNVSWPQEGSLVNLIKAMSLLEDLPMELDLCIPIPSSAVLDAVRGRNNVHLRAVPPGEVQAVQQAASLLFLPLSWGTPAPDIIATASPGKFTDYLASGRPMLVHAPPEAFVSRLGRDRGIATVVDVDDVEALAAAIREIYFDPALGQALAWKARALFEEDFDAGLNARKLASRLGGDCSSAI